MKKGTKKKGKGTPAKVLNKKQTEAVAEQPKAKKYGVCAFILERLQAGDETKAILDAIHAEFPQSKATGKDVSIVRCKIGRAA